MLREPRFVLRDVPCPSGECMVCQTLWHHPVGKEGISPPKGKPLSPYLPAY